MIKQKEPPEVSQIGSVLTVVRLSVVTETAVGAATIGDNLPSRRFVSLKVLSTSRDLQSVHLLGFRLRGSQPLERVDRVLPVPPELQARSLEEFSIAELQQVEAREWASAGERSRLSSLNEMLQLKKIVLLRSPSAMPITLLMNISSSLRSC